MDNLCTLAVGFRANFDVDLAAWGLGNATNFTATDYDVKLCLTATSNAWASNTSKVVVSNALNITTDPWTADLNLTKTVTNLMDGGWAEALMMEFDNVTNVTTWCTATNAKF